MIKIITCFMTMCREYNRLPQFSNVTTVELRVVTLGPMTKRPGGPGEPTLPCAPGSP